MYPQRQEFVIVGWTQSDKRIGFRCIASRREGEGKLDLRLGKVGTGFNAELMAELMDKMEPLAIDKAAVDAAALDRKGAHWIEPKLVAEINFAEFTDDEFLRHPSFIALREDKPASEVVVEEPRKLKAIETRPSKKGKDRPRDGGGLRH